MKHRLKEQMDRYGDSQEELAEYLGVTYQTLSKKLNGHGDFSRTEIRKMKDRYSLTAQQIDHIFFTD